MGSLTQDALGAVIKAADLFVLNTAHEGLSHQLIEVMDLGTPIVTTKVGGNPELITDGVHGLLVPYNDAEALEEAILRVINHPESVERMTQSARARSKDFDKAITINQLVELLKAVKK
jgi:glycosyltransferase involved in cell wall biosynthesis